MRNITEIQQRLIALGYLQPGEDDGKFGGKSLDAFNHFRASKGLGPVVQTSMSELNAVLFPEEVPPAPPKRSNPISDFFTGLLVRKGVELLTSHMKGLSTMPFLTGYKTYITAAVMIVVAVAALFGIYVPGFEFADPGTLLVSAFGIIFARSGAKTEAKKVG